MWHQNCWKTDYSPNFMKHEVDSDWQLGRNAEFTLLLLLAVHAVARKVFLKPLNYKVKNSIRVRGTLFPFQLEFAASPSLGIPTSEEIRMLCQQICRKTNPLCVDKCVLSE